MEKRSFDRSPRKFDSEKLNTYIEKNPDVLLKDVAAKFNGSVTGAFHALNRKKLMLKKRYNTKGETKFESELAEIPKETDVIYVDESGVQKEINPTRSRSKCGVRVYQETGGKRLKKDNVIAGYLNGIVLACSLYRRLDSRYRMVFFGLSIRSLSLLKPNSVIVIDNATFHSRTYLPVIAEAYGHKILWLPKYSPDKNPIEHVWANMKNWLRYSSKNYSYIRLAIRDHFQ